jgi:membrane protease YdiL (CAAX protease family)
VSPQSRTLTSATITGLFIALALPFVTYGVSLFTLTETEPTTRVLLGLLVHWVSFFLIILLIQRWEREPLTSIGLRPLRWWTIPAGLVAGVVIAIVSGMIVGVLRLPADIKTLEYLQSLPFGLRLLLVLTAGIFEETMYRGYALERLATLFGNRWLAGAVTLVLFTLAHAPGFGLRNILPVAVVSVFVTLLYLWRRDLVLNMVAHAAIDALGMLVAPSMGGAS